MTRKLRFLWQALESSLSPLEWRERESVSGSSETGGRTFSPRLKRSRSLKSVSKRVCSRASYVPPNRFKRSDRRGQDARAESFSLEGVRHADLSMRILPYFTADTSSIGPTHLCPHVDTREL